MNQLSIRRLRQLAGKTKNEIADLLGMSVNTYSKYEDNPMSLSYAAYHQLIEYLETAIQIRKKLEKEQPMNTPIKAKVRFVAPDEDDEDRLSDYTVPIPEGLTEEFHPSQPVTPKQLLDWETKNKEPYPGYSEEFFNWENAWERGQPRPAESRWRISPPLRPGARQPGVRRDDRRNPSPTTSLTSSWIRKAATPACTSTRLTCQPRKSPNPIQ